MSYSVESLDVAPIQNPTGPKQFDLPSKEFVGYDPKGMTSITGSPIERPDPAIQKQENNAEAVAEIETPAPEESVKLSPQLTALARKEQAQRKREQALIQREKALEAKLADAEKYSQLKAKVAANDYSAADELGITYEGLTKYEIDKQSKLSPEEQRVRQVEEKLSAMEKAREEDTVKEYEHNQSLWKAEIAKVVTENPEFSTIKELGLEAMVLQHVNDSFEEDGIELTAEQAAKEIEEEAVARAEKFSSVSKIKNKVVEPQKVLGAPKTSPKTITQNMTVTSAATKPKPFHLMSESEQIAEAIRRVQAAKLQR